MDDIKARDGRQQGRKPHFVLPRQSVPPGARSAWHPPTPPKPTRQQPVATKEFFSPEKNTISKSKQSAKRRWPLVLLIIVVLLALAAAAYWWGIRPRLQSKPPVTSNQQSVTAPKPEPEKPTGNFRIVATGDIITHDSVIQNARLGDGSYNFSPMFDELKPFLEKSKTRICHNTVPAAGGTLSGYPSFNAPSELIANLASSGCNVMSLASDHINDKGQAAIDATLAEIDKQKAITVTAGANRSAEEQTKEGAFNIGDGYLKFGYFSFTTKQAKASSAPFSVNVYEKNTTRQQIETMKSKVDFVIVSICWGKEDSGDIIAEQDVIAQELADAGADIIFGHCTHQVQPVKRLKTTNSREAIVYYSLGNALNSQLPIETLVGGLGVIDIDVTTKKITNVGFLPTYMHYEWTPQQKAAKSLGSRTNLMLYPLDKAAAPLAASQNGTTVEAQTQRVQEIINRFTPTKILTSADLNN